MEQNRQIRILQKFVDWVNDVQKDIPRIGRDFENAFENELDAKVAEIIDLMNIIGELHSMTESAKNYSIDLIQKLDSRQEKKD